METEEDMSADMGRLLAAMSDVFEAMYSAHEQRMLSQKAMLKLNDPLARARRVYVELMQKHNMALTPYEALS